MRRRKGLNNRINHLQERVIRNAYQDKKIFFFFFFFNPLFTQKEKI